MKSEFLRGVGCSFCYRILFFHSILPLLLILAGIQKEALLSHRCVGEIAMNFGTLVQEEKQQLCNANWYSRGRSLWYQAGYWRFLLQLPALPQRRYSSISWFVEVWVVHFHFIDPCSCCLCGDALEEKGGARWLLLCDTVMHRWYFQRDQQRADEGNSKKAGWRGMNHYCEWRTVSRRPGETEEGRCRTGCAFLISLQRVLHICSMLPSLSSFQMILLHSLFITVLTWEKASQLAEYHFYLSPLWWSEWTYQQYALLTTLTIPFIHYKMVRSFQTIITHYRQIRLARKEPRKTLPTSATLPSILSSLT